MKALIQLALLGLVLYVLATAPTASAALAREGGHAMQHVAAGVSTIVRQLAGQKG